MKILKKAYSIKGVDFLGVPRYIDISAYLDALGGLQLGDRVVISRNVTILSHDYSPCIGYAANGIELDKDKAIFLPVKIGSNCFIGAGAIILPGTVIGNYVIIGAGAVVKGIVDDYSIIVGNPAVNIGNTQEWGKKYMGELGDILHQDKY